MSGRREKDGGIRLRPTCRGTTRGAARMPPARRAVPSRSRATPFRQAAGNSQARQKTGTGTDTTASRYPARFCAATPAAAFAAAWLRLWLAATQPTSPAGSESLPAHSAARTAATAATASVARRARSTNSSGRRHHQGRRLAGIAAPQAGPRPSHPRRWPSTPTQTLTDSA